jgi:tetratricopeptide (TPR) repeat protein
MYLTHPLWHFFAINSVVSLLMAGVSVVMLKERYAQKSKRTFLFFILFNLAMPIVGVVLTLWIVYYLRMVTYEKKLENVHYIDMSEFTGAFIKVKRIFGEGSMKELLTNDALDPSMKMKALVSLSDNIQKRDIPLIKGALSSQNDEIRLYSFAIIDNLERNINNRIHQKMQIFRNSKKGMQEAKLAKELALLYWEVVYFELADEELKLFIAKEVDRYASKALVHMPEDNDLHFLLGRCCLLTGEYKRAIAYLEVIVDRDRRAVPYLAELYFIEKSYEKVGGLLAHAEWLRSDQILNPVVEIWHKEAA